MTKETQTPARNLFGNAHDIGIAVREALAPFGFDNDKRQILWSFLTTALAPLDGQAEFGRRGTNDARERRADMLFVATKIFELIDEYADSLLSVRNVPTETLCATLFLALGPENTRQGIKIARSSTHKNTILAAQNIFNDAMQALAHGSYQYPESALVAELRAIFSCKTILAISASSIHQNAELVADITRYASLLAKSNTPMAQHFRGMLDEIALKIPNLTAVQVARAETGGAAIHVLGAGRRPAPKAF